MTNRSNWRTADVTRPNWPEPRELTDAEEARIEQEQEEEELADAWLLGLPEAQEDHDPIDQHDLEG